MTVHHTVQNDCGLQAIDDSDSLAVCNHLCAYQKLSWLKLLIAIATYDSIPT